MGGHNSSRRPLRAGLKLAQQNTTLADLREIWRIADQAGFDHAWVFDHLVPISGTDGVGPVLDGWSLLAAMAEATERVRIGVMVTSNTFRHPAVLAKMATTVDHLSGGRLEMGLGAGWVEIEHAMLGIPFHTLGERISRLGEACAVIKQLWTEEVANFSGRYYTLTDARSDPKPLQKPHPPLWIGGRGERRTLRFVAQYADAWNLAGDAVPEAARLGAVLDGHCADVGRNPAEIRRSVQLRYSGADPDQLLGEVAPYLEHGFTEFVFTLSGPYPVLYAQALGERFLPALRSLSG